MRMALLKLRLILTKKISRSFEPHTDFRNKYGLALNEHKKILDLLSYVIMILSISNLRSLFVETYLQLILASGLSRKSQDTFLTEW